MGHEESHPRFRNLGELCLGLASAAMMGAGGTVGRDQMRLAGDIRASAGSDEMTSFSPYPVPQPMADEILKRMFDFSRIAKLCRKVPITGNGIQACSFRETSRVDGSRLGGISSAWGREAQTIPTSRPALQQIHAETDSLKALIYVTEELLGRTTSLGDSLTSAAAEEFAVQVDGAIIAGTGVGKPEGFLNAAATIEVAKHEGQAAATLTRGNVLRMLQRLWPYSDGRAVWLCSRSAQLALTEGDAADLIQYALPGADRAESPMTLAGLPLIVCEQCAPLGTTGDLLLVDPGEYLLGDRGATRRFESIHVRFEYHERAFKFVLETAGRPNWSTPVAAYNGTDSTQSAFVKLATRA